MTEGEGHTADIDDAAATRPSPAKSHRVAAILSPLSLRPLRFFLRNEIRDDRNCAVYPERSGRSENNPGVNEFCEP